MFAKNQEINISLQKPTSMNNMLLITSTWGPAKTFKMIPVTKDCPFNECIFDVQSKVLAVISKESKESLHMLPKLTDTGDVMRLKIGKKDNGKDYAEERKALVTFYEYYVTEKQEITDFVQKFAINANDFNFTEYLNLEIPKEGIAPTSNIVTSLV
jgi:hypothetical protein